LASDLAEYYCKGPSLQPGHPFVAVNELLVNRLARYVGIPVRNAELIRWRDKLFVGIEILKRKMTGGLTQGNWVRLSNAATVAYLVVAFDVWVLNTDRHEGNWLGGVLSDDAGWFIANDHDCAILPPGRQPADLAALVASADANCVRVEAVRNAIRDGAALRAAVESIKTIDDATITQLVGQMPTEWADEAAKKCIRDFLIGRRDALAVVVETIMGIFPNLKRSEENPAG